jgi:hypothetical protein
VPFGRGSRHVASRHDDLAAGGADQNPLLRRPQGDRDGLAGSLRQPPQRQRGRREEPVPPQVGLEDQRNRGWEGSSAVAPGRVHPGPELSGGGGGFRRVLRLVRQQESPGGLHLRVEPIQCDSAANLAADPREGKIFESV